MFGAMRLVQLVLPTMRQQKSGTIVNITSMGGKIYTPLGGWYHATKFALEALSDCLRLEVRPFGIDVVVIEPGGIATEWGAIVADAIGTAVTAPRPKTRYVVGYGARPLITAHSILSDRQFDTLITRATGLPRG